mgnify:CR=1 FL=1
MNDKQLARYMKALGVETRIKLLQLLKKQPYCVNALAHHLLITPAAVSQHLRVLRDLDLVRDEKFGNFVHYSLNQETFATWQKEIGELFKV